MSEPAQRKYRIQRITSEAEIAELAGPWTELLATMPAASIFLTWEWISTWWRNREPQWDLWLLAAWDEAGRLAGLAPWMLSDERLGPVRLRRLEFVHNSGMLANRMDIIAGPAEQKAVCAAFLAYLQAQRGQWDVLDLEALAATSAVQDCLASAHGIHVRRDPFVCPYATLPATWEAYESEHLSANRRQQLRARARRLERDHPGRVAYRRVEDPAAVSSALDTLVALNERRWHQKGLHASFDDECFVAFQREFALLAAQRGWLRLYLLEVDGTTIAAEYCFRFRHAFVNFQRGFDLAWDRYSPGLLLFAHAFREAIAEGATEFDMLRGAHEYKLSWADRQRFDLHPVLSSTWAGHASLVSGVLFDTAQSFARRALPTATRERINQFLAGRRS